MPVTHAETTLDQAGKKALLHRICESSRFQKAPRLRQFLLYIGERTVDHENDPPRETEIGCAVFDRDPGYAPSEDNIVRNAARQLRTKLREYFAEEGGQEAWAIDIPKGGYRVVFVPRAPLPPQTEVVLSESANDIPPDRHRRIWIGAGAAALCASLAANIILGIRARSTPGSPDHLIAALFPAGARPLRIVVGDYGSYLLTQLSHRKALSLDEYTSRRNLEFHPAESPSPDIQSFGNTLATRLLVSMGELNAAHALADSFGSGVEIRHARTLAARDLRHPHQILLGTTSTNPWFELFERSLHFRATGRGFVDNRNGKQYGIAEPAASGGRSYVRIAALSGLGEDGNPGQGITLVIHGVNMGAVECGAEFALSEPALKQLRQSLGGGSALPARFEALIETATTDFTPNRSRLLDVAAH